MVAVPLVAGLTGDFMLPALMATASALWDGDRDYGRFGARVLAADINGDGGDDAVFAAPLRTEDVTEELYGAEQGVRLLLVLFCCIGLLFLDYKTLGSLMFLHHRASVCLFWRPPISIGQCHCHRLRRPEPPQTCECTFFSWSARV